MSAVDQQLRERASAEPTRVALVACAGERVSTWTWAELERETAQVAERVAAAAPRTRRCVLMAPAGNAPTAVLSLIGMLRTDLPLAVFSPAAPRLEVHALGETLLRRGHDVMRVQQNRVHLRSSGSPMPAPLPRESVLLPSGGSSGKPKLVVDTRMRTVARRPRTVRPSTAMNWRPGQRQMVIGPLHHTATLTFFAEGLCDGNTLIVQESFDPVVTLRTIGNWRVEWLQVTPYHLRHLTIAMRKWDPELSSVRGLLHLAAPCPARLKRHWVETLGAERIFEIYGSTEGVGMTLARGDEWVQRPGTVGRGFFTHIRILDQTGQQQPPGETGTIFMRSGPLVRSPYLDADDGISATADGFVSVGDQGRLDADGYLYLTAKQLMRIQVGGETVDPSEVESVLMQHPDVLDAAVTGTFDDRLGESLVAFVVSAGANDAKAMKSYLRERMARHKVPRLVRFVGQLPYTEAGKLDRRRLAEATGHGGLVEEGAAYATSRADR
jgi:bile acid-coenzyme A ligase